ncbi:hypothetical protein DERF_003063 [Dermatophagoides farinae]|uniref:Uncharacterized protein n=1 Tax=Dermatophagoides farinae TaxID=6954 RepID=A0A922IGD1_DERFA|nr:hypothetical protein DERF_003063 [Dermatophagoides farinae]
MTTIIEYNQFNDQRKLEILFEGNTYKQQQQQQQQEKCIEWDSIFFLLGQCNILAIKYDGLTTMKADFFSDCCHHHHKQQGLKVFFMKNLNTLKL